MDTSVNIKEVDKFAAIANEWWDPTGKFKPLHQYNPLRIDYITRQCGRVFKPKNQELPLKGLRILDVGCGGGILCEALAKLGADVTGIDAAPESIEVAKHHAAQEGLKIKYFSLTAEALHEQKQTFDVVTCLEVIEHVDNVTDFVATLSNLTQKNGVMFWSTINRTPGSYLKAIVGAEYILRLLPRGTHDHARFVKPSELRRYLAASGCELLDVQGVNYSPFSQKFTYTENLDTNYLAVARKN